MSTLGVVRESASRQEGYKTLVRSYVRSRRARGTGSLAELRPLAMAWAIPGGPRLATDPVRRAETLETYRTGH